MLRQVVGHRRLLHTQQIGQFADALLAIGQVANDLEPALVAEHLEEL